MAATKSSRPHLGKHKQDADTAPEKKQKLEDASATGVVCSCCRLSNDVLQEVSFPLDSCGHFICLECRRYLIKHAEKYGRAACCSECSTAFSPAPTPSSSARIMFTVIFKDLQARERITYFLPDETWAAVRRMCSQLFELEPGRFRFVFKNRQPDDADVVSESLSRAGGNVVHVIERLGGSGAVDATAKVH